jgi:hypothetical protein
MQGWGGGAASATGSQAPTLRQTKWVSAMAEAVKLCMGSRVYLQIITLSKQKNVYSQYIVLVL